MSGARYARLASRALAQAHREPPPPPSPFARAAAIGAIEQAILRRARAKRRSRWLGGLAAAAAVAAVIGVGARYVSQRERGAVASGTAAGSADSVHLVGVGRPVAGVASVVVAGVPAPVSDDRPLPAGSRVVTAKTGRVLLAFSTGTSGLLEEGGDVTLDSIGAEERLRLEAGSLDLHVAKQAPGRRFVVRTADAEVEVRGTQFRVSVTAPDASCGAGTTTRVSVSEGVVVVRHAGSEARVGAGEQWPSGCGSQTHEESGPERGRASSVGSPSAPAPAVVSGSTSAAVTGSTPAASASLLATQNDLFAQAIAAKRRGDTPGALATLDRLLARYPSGPLAESASIERMRLLRASDPGRATSAAHAYLARYPNGSARAEAEAILAAAP
jgi:ferric-dicitrate binding protein FerR (iron transport regulator)